MPLSEHQLRRVEYSCFVLTARRPDGAEIQNALASLTGRRTVPNVFINQKSIGGGDDTEHLYRIGKLQEMVQGL